MSKPPENYYGNSNQGKSITWISGMTAAVCGQCGGIFSMTDGECPKKDGGREGWTPVNSTKARSEIARLRDALTLVEGQLQIIASASTKRTRAIELADRTIDFIHKNRTPPGSAGASNQERSAS